LLVPFWLAALGAFAFGVGTAVGAATVHYRDASVITTSALQVLLYLTPITYSASAVPERFRTLYQLNPLRPLIEGMRWSLVGTPAPSLISVLASAATGAIVLFAGCAVFTRLERTFADVI
jgi:lipopolysaccharide transport system permease protein